MVDDKGWFVALARPENQVYHRKLTVRMTMTRSLAVVATLLLLCFQQPSIIPVHAKLADRSRIVRQRQDSGKIAKFHDNGRAIAGPGYRSRLDDSFETSGVENRLRADEESREKQRRRNAAAVTKPAPWKMQPPSEEYGSPLAKGDAEFPQGETPEEFNRRLSSQLSGCCYNYQKYSASDLCYIYGNDCESGETPSHDSGDDDCSQDGLSFIGISFSVNTNSGNPYSYQLCDQFPMENIIDRDYDYTMSMDEDGWLVGGGYKTFDYSGKMPYIDSSHTELLRIGNLDPDMGGTSIDQVYEAMESISFAPFSIFPEYLKAGGGHNSGDNDGNSVPSGDVTLIVSIVETYEDDDSYSSYESFIDELFTAMYNVGGGPCMDDDDTDPHVSMSRGVKFWSSYHSQQYLYSTNLEIAVWQSMYPNGVPIGSSGYAAFPPGRSSTKVSVGYGSLYFFFDRANITQSFSPYRELTDTESYYATLYSSSDTSSFYSSVTSIDFDYSGSGSGDNNDDWEWNPYSWNQQSAMHDMTDGWELPPGCLEEGETFFGIPLSRASDSKLQSTVSFQEQFDFDYLADRNGTYISSFGTNHGWLIGEELGNAVGSIVDKDTSHIPIFYTGNTNPNMGGMALEDLISVARGIDFGTLYIKPAFVFVDDSGHLKLQFEADTSSALAYLYDSLCKELGITWNYESPSNDLGVYSSCSMHSAGDRAAYGCGPDGSNTGGFCPQMTLAYSPRFQSEDLAAAYLSIVNSYIDYYRSLYPSGVAVGTSKFCSSGGCLGLFLNRIDLYYVFSPDKGGSWVEYNGASMPPTFSPAPTWKGGCDEPHNLFLDKCVRKRFKPKPSAVAWEALGSVGKLSVMLVLFMALTLSVSIFLARARKKRRRGETYLAFFFRDLTRKRKKKGRKGSRGLHESMLPETTSRRSKSSRSSSRRSKSRSKSKGRKSRSRSRSKSIRQVSVQPERSKSRNSDRRHGERSRSRDFPSNASVGTESQRSGVFDLTVSTPQPEEAKDTRQQLV